MAFWKWWTTLILVVVGFAAAENTLSIIEIFTDVVIVKDKEDNKFEVYMNNIIKPSEG